jgi:hypothetical protein
MPADVASSTAVYQPVAAAGFTVDTLAPLLEAGSERKG